MILSINSVDRTAYLAHGSLNLSAATVDFVLIDPPAVPSMNQAVSINTPSWTGTVVQTVVSDKNLAGHKWVKVTAKTDMSNGASASGIHLQDSNGDFRDLELETTYHDATTETRGSLVTYTDGLWPLKTFQITSSNHGLSAQSFTVREVNVRWLDDGTEEYKVTFGATIVELDAWIKDDSNVFPIGETYIDDNAVTTPKIAANAVTAGKIDVTAMSTDNLVTDPLFTLLGNSDTSGWPGTSGSAFEAGAAGSGTLYKRGPYRLIANGYPTPVNGSRYTDLIPINGTASGPYHTVVLEHALDNYTSGTARFRIEFLDSTKATISTTTLSSYTANQSFGPEVFYLKPYGASDPSSGESVVEMASGTCYVKLHFDTNSASLNADWYITAVGLFPGLSGFMSLGGQAWNTDYQAVSIQPGGLLIRNGKLTFADKFGTNVIDGGGFGGQWVKFIQNGMYNADFSVGSTSDLAVTETGSGSGTDNYKNSISSDLPYWVVAASGATLQLEANSSASGGYQLHSQGTSGTNRVYQDVPVTPGAWPLLEINKKWTTPSTSEVTLTVKVSYRDSTHAIIGSEYSTATLYNDEQVAFLSDFIDVGLAVSEAPGNAAYLRVTLEITHGGAAGTSEMDINEVSLVRNGDVQLHSPVFTGQPIFEDDTEIRYGANLWFTNAGITAGGDNNDILNISGGISAPDADASWASLGASTTTYTITTAGTYYWAASNVYRPFTPQFTGQRFLFIFTGATSLNTATAQYTLLRMGIGTTATGHGVSTLGYSRAYSAATAPFLQHSIVGYYEAPSTDTKYVSVAATVQTTNGAVVTLAYGNLVVVPLP